MRDRDARSRCAIEMRDGCIRVASGRRGVRSRSTPCTHSGIFLTAPLMPFSSGMTSRQLKQRARALLRERFGHSDFQAGQWDPMEAALPGHDAIVVMPTGSGKSLVYQLPALMLPGLTVVVSPLIALMKDQQDKLVAHGVDALAMHSHLTDAEARKLAARVGEGGGEILYLTPERFKD